MSENQYQERFENRLWQDNIIYMLNYEEKTANIIGFTSLKDDIILPRSIVHDSTEYVIKCICEHAFNFSEIKSIEFEIPIDSEIQTIENEAFKLSSIESLTIPPSLTNLEQKWSEGSFLKNVRVIPNNPRYKSYDDNKMIIGKKSLEDDEYDVLIFCSRDIQTITIPNFIKSIGPFCFNECRLLHTIEFEKNSQLQTIEKCAFSGTSIKNFVIPPSVTIICRSAFSTCLKIERFEIPDNSQLQTIEDCVFNFVPIESLKIPSKLVDLNERWCSGLRNLKNIFVNPENPKLSFIDNKFLIEKSSLENNEYDILSFCSRDVQAVKIPSFIKTIGSLAFQLCIKLKIVDISCDSNLQVIKSNAFSYSSIMKFTVPSQLVRICSDAFSDCNNLRIFEIPNDSKLQTIEEGAFIKTSIECLNISPHILNIEKYSFASCKRLQIIEINENSQIKNIYQKAFTGCGQIIFMIPVKLNIEFIPSSSKIIKRKVKIFS